VTEPPRRQPFAAATAAVLRPMRGLLAFLVPDDPPLELNIVGRTVFHAVVVGLAAGLLGCAFFAALELIQHVVLERGAGYQPLLARGEQVVAPHGHTPFRWWLLLFLPAAGALLGGLVSRYAPETRGGGGDAAIEAFHQHGGVMRSRILWVKPLASIFTLGGGGSGGREGPTMQIGGALGSTVGLLLRTTARERRVLMVAGIAAGISAVFRTPLGAALLAIEVLYRDDFESEALIPAVLASVVSYSVAISIFGQSTLFGDLPTYPFVPEHLPLYAALALVIAVVASLLVATMGTVRRLAARLPGPVWLRPAIGGLLVGGFAVALMLTVGPALDRAGKGLGVLGGGYGAAQAAITGADWLPGGWFGVQILFLLAGAKLMASSLTIGTGGSAGDFAPCIVIGGLIGGAFGRAAQILLADPSIQPGAFALVGMGAFYGGVAHVPLAALVMVSEISGAYDLLVPLMLAEGIAFVALRKVSLYGSQPRRLHDSPVHAVAPPENFVRRRAGDLVRRDRQVVVVAPDTPTQDLLASIDAAIDQDVFPVVDEAGGIHGLIPIDAVRHLATHPDVGAWAIAADLMRPPVTVSADSDLRAAAQALVAADLRAIPVLDEQGRMIGLLDEHDLSRAYLAASAARRASSRMGTAEPLP
jgi:CIC family chloride channel protein